MARYGNEYYGLTLYGADTLVDFDVSPFTARSIGYNNIFVEWTAPTGDWDVFRLIRNGFGFPMTPDDGDVLIVGTTASNERSYLDQGQVPNNTGLIQGRTYYYTLFVRVTSTQQWVSAGNALGVAIKNYDTADLMYEYLPNIYKITNPYSISDNNSQINDDLFNFLSIFAVEHDLFKTNAENIKNRYDPLALDGRLVPMLLNEFGFNFEKEIGIQQARSLIKNAVKIYSERGSISGLKTFVTAFTGFNCDIRPITNLMLDYNNASFRESLGFWETTTNTTLARGSVSSETPQVEPYSEPNSPSNFPNSTVGFLKLTAASAGNIVVACGLSAPTTRGVSVVEGQTYTLTGYVRAKTTGRVVSPAIRWYDRFGALISTSSVTGVANASGVWNRTSAVTAVAPANARYAVPQFTIASAALNEIHYMDAVQFEQSATATTFTDARRVDVVLRANRINQVINPSFEVDITNWTAATTASAARVAGGAVNGSSYSAELTALIAGTLSWTSDEKVTVQSGDQNAFSAYVKGLTNMEARLVITWYDELDVVIGAPTTTTYTSLLPTEWQRLGITALAPANAVKAELSIEATADNVGDKFQVDAVLFERASFVVPYFDGASGYEQTGDILWQGGSVSSGRSHYYKNREVIVKRLIQVLPEYLPTGAPWAVFVAQPD